MSIHLANGFSFLFLLLGFSDLFSVLLNLFDEIDKVSVSIWAVVGARLFAFINKFDGSLDAVDRFQTKVEVQGGALCVLLQLREPVSKLPSNIIMDFTYRCGKN